MPSIPLPGSTFTFSIPLVSQADSHLFKAAATIAAGDFKRSINNGAFANMDNLPAVTPAAGKLVQIIVSAAETTAAGEGGTIDIVGSDAAGAEWDDIGICLRVGVIGANAMQLSGDAGAADNAELFFDGTGYAGTNNVIPTVTTLTNMPAAPPSAADVGSEVWTGEYTRQINSVLGTVSANLVQMNGDTDPVDNLVLALGNSDGITAHPQGIADAVNNLAPASTPAAGSIGDHLDDLATALAAATATLTVVSAVDGGELSIYQAVSFQATISGLAIPADWTKVYWTVKRATSEADADAILQLVETNPGAGTDGLLRLNGAAGTAANGTLTINQAAGTVVIDLVMTICDDLALATGLVWSLKALRPTSASTLLAVGTINVLGQATAAVA